VESGAQWLQLYAQAGVRKLMLAGGASVSVGIGGYLTGGGHGPLSPVYGLGADNVLEMEAVTPNAELITANECQNSEYFWALRGVRIILSPTCDC
jgi:FAD/FMN-containing dehydrogenase